jgi:hypothetical protein
MPRERRTIQNPKSEGDSPEEVTRDLPDVPPQGIVNLLETSAESADTVGRCAHFEAVFSPQVGYLRRRIGVSSGRVEAVLSPTR